MSSILTYLAVQDGRIKRSSLEVLTRSKSIAAELGVEAHAAILHSQASELASTAYEYGATRVFTVQDPVFDTHQNATLLAGLEEVVRAANPRLMAAASTEGIKDVVGALAIRLDAAVLPDVASFEATPEEVTCARPVMAAKLLARTSTRHPLVFVTVRSGSYESVPSVVDGAVHEVPFSFDVSGLKQALREVVTAAGSAVDLSEARVVVAAGRGVRDEAGRELVQELARVTGAAIGASRAVVENGLFPATAQIGQTGKVVSPELYFAIGISGAIQHSAGMSNSRIIVAINKDPDAPIFKLATYGLVGDLYRILPLLITQLKNGG